VGVKSQILKKYTGKFEIPEGLEGLAKTTLRGVGAFSGTTHCIK